MTVSETAGYEPLPPTPAPTSAPTSPTPANTIGCFKDHRLSRIMTDRGFSSTDMTNEVGEGERPLYGWSGRVLELNAVFVLLHDRLHFVTHVSKQCPVDIIPCYIFCDPAYVPA